MKKLLLILFLFPLFGHSQDCSNLTDKTDPYTKVRKIGLSSLFDIGETKSSMIVAPVKDKYAMLWFFYFYTDHVRTLPAHSILYLKSQDGNVIQLQAAAEEDRVSDYAATGNFRNSATFILTQSEIDKINNSGPFDGWKMYLDEGEIKEKQSIKVKEAINCLWNKALELNSGPNASKKDSTIKN